MVVISLMWICVKIPSLVRRYVMQHQRLRPGAQIFRVSSSSKACGVPSARRGKEVEQT